VVRLAGRGHQVWFVWMGGYQTYGTSCETIGDQLQADRHFSAQQMVTGVPPTQQLVGYEGMSLIRYSPVAG